MEEKINQILQSAIISLCSQHYSEKLEVDGIICISSQQTNLRHVVKIHQTVDPNNLHHGQRVSPNSSPAPASTTPTQWTTAEERDDAGREDKNQKAIKKYGGK